MSLIEFPYTFHKHYSMPIIPILIEGHKLWAFVDSGATFSILSIDDARRLGRTGIFDEFQVCFNDHSRKVTFQKILIEKKI